MKNLQIVLLIASILVSSCSSEAQAPTELPATATIELPTETPTAIPFTATPPAPASAEDPTLFGAIGTGEIQGFAIESFANAIFTKTMDSLKAGSAIQDYQTLRVTVFPGNGGLLAEVTFNVQTADPAWLADGGTQAANNWVNDKCYRFDFVTTETEYQLRNKRLCN